MGTAEAIVVMNGDIQDVDSNLADIGQRCNPRLVEKKSAHLGQIKSDVLDKDADKRAFGAQLALLHRCAATLSRLLRRRSSLLLSAKLFVISRLLHTTLSQRQTVPPFLETLRVQLASLRKTLEKRIKKCLGLANSTADETIEALAAYCLATSSSSDDAIRNFRDVRLGVIDHQLSLTDPSGENVLKAFLLYIRTLQTSKVLLSRRLSDVLSKLKTRPILSDPDIRGLDDLALDTFGHWAAAEVTNFTPWIKLSELSKSDAEKTIKQWSKQAFQAVAKGCQSSLASWNGFSDLLMLRKRTLELWLSSRSSTPTHSSLGVLDGIKTMFNEQLTRILSDQAKKLGLFGQDISSAIAYWESNEHPKPQSIWDHNLISLDYSNGATQYKQIIMDRLLGRDEAISSILQGYQTWRSEIESSRQSINELKRTKWADILEEGEDEDPDVDIVAMLNEDDPQSLQDALQSAVRQSLNSLQESFRDTFEAFGQSNRDAKSAYLLRLIRLIRRNLPVELVSNDFTFSSAIIPKLQEMLATEIIAQTTSFDLSGYSKPKKLPGRSLWEGEPELPVQPSSYMFRYLRNLVQCIDQHGSDLWDVSTAQVLKKTLQGEISKSITSLFDDMESAFTKSEANPDEKPDAADPDSKEQTGAVTDKPDSPKDNIRDRKIQLFFDTAYIKDMLSVKNTTDDKLADTLGRLRGSLGLDANKEVVIMEKAAHEYWKRTKLLFGALSAGSE